MRLSKRHAKLLTEDLWHGNVSTNRWRDFVPLQIKGLVEIDEDENIFGMRRVVTTEAGKRAQADRQKEREK